MDEETYTSVEEAPVDDYDPALDEGDLPPDEQPESPGEEGR